MTFLKEILASEKEAQHNIEKARIKASAIVSEAKALSEEEIISIKDGISKERVQKIELFDKKVKEESEKRAKEAKEKAQSLETKASKNKEKALSFILSSL